MPNISHIDSRNVASLSKDNESEDEIFYKKVLHYIESNKPEDKLKELLISMKELSPENHTLSQLNQALIFTTEIMRKKPEHTQYLKDVLYERCYQLQGVNMFFENMMYKTFAQPDEDTELELY